ncbi:ABC transporter ATP-binding protein [Amycolatopsis benzoatilytica]|uniref:ABC transporter ATP-binding protein n=1 Tax=Amycolatopsis benzoatilytica TaxID=346045 RepID=UPI0003A5423C|nr:ATP-binding cassette domain-containing protein [Amycolatopsis benzoatilytica]
MTQSDAAAVRGEGLTHSYRTAGRSLTALHEVTISAARGRITALVGPSGSGKSTLLRMLACLERPDEGRVEVGGTDVTALSARARRAIRRRRIGYVFQNPVDNLLDYLTVREHLELAARMRGIAPVGADLLDRLGLDHRAGHRPRQLSGGEQQRTALAFAAVGDPAAVLADEPTAQLDRASAHLVAEALRALAEAGQTVVVATHDPLLMAAADDTAELVDGRIR